MIEPELANALINAPVAEKQPARSEQALNLDWLWHMANCTEDPASREMWQGRLQCVKSLSLTPSEASK